MPSWFDVAGVTALAALATAAGWRAGALRRPWWLIVYLAALSVVLAVAATRRSVPLQFLWPLSGLTAGHTDFLVMAAALPLLFATLARRIEQRRLRVLLGILGLIVLVHYALRPFLEPVLLAGRHAALRTRLDSDGVCLQSEFYTCGPAASVTLLRRLGLPADEASLTLAAGTGPAIGTPADILAGTLTRVYAPRVTAEHRLFASVDELARALPAIAIVKYRFMVDHYVAVLEVRPDAVVLGDPLRGRRVLPRAEFEDLWRRNAVVLVVAPPR